jgi:hypothetical protein
MEENKLYSGKISVSLAAESMLIDLCIRHIPGYDPDRLKVVAFRIFSGQEFIVTVYAQDKEFQPTIHPGKVMVRKFKLTHVSPADLLACLGEFNTTLFAESYGDFDMEVINK